MAGYTPVFDSVFQGSLCGKYPDLPVWLVLLALSQKGGIIDAHPSYIATVSGLPQADIEAAIKRFCEPDPSSRTPDHDGRRLEPIPGRGFGWVILNHGKYQAKARKKDYDDERTASGADAARKAAERQASRIVPTSPESSRNVPLSSPSPSPSPEDQEGARKRASRLTEDWKPSEADRSYAIGKGLDPELTAEKFRNYWLAKSGKDAAKLDWSRTWQNWCIEEVQRRPAKPSAPPKREREPTADEIAAARARAAAENATGIAKALKLPSLGVGR